MKYLRPFICTVISYLLVAYTTDYLNPFDVPTKVRGAWVFLILMVFIALLISVDLWRAIEKSSSTRKVKR